MSKANSIIFYIPFFNQQLKLEEFEDKDQLEFKNQDSLDTSKIFIEFKKISILNDSIKFKRTITEKVFKTEIKNKIRVSLDLYLIKTSKDFDEFNLFIFKLELYSINEINYSFLIQFFQNNRDELNHFIYYLFKKKPVSVCRKFIEYFYELHIKSFLLFSSLIYYYNDEESQDLKQVYHLTIELYKDSGNLILVNPDGRNILFLKKVHTLRSSYDAKTILLRVFFFRLVTWLKTKRGMINSPEYFFTIFENYAHYLVNNSRHSLVYKRILENNQFFLNSSRSLTHEQISNFLDKADEEDFTQIFLIPLFKTMGFEKVVAKGHEEHILEFGQDIKLMKFCLPTGHYLYFVAQIKVGTIGASSKHPTNDIESILAEIRPAFRNDIFDSDIGRKMKPDHVFFITSGKIGEQAKLYLYGQIEKEDRNIRLLEREDLIALYKYHGLPEENQQKIEYYKPVRRRVKKSRRK